MYVNFQLLREKKLKIKTITDLTAIRQNKLEDLSEYLSSELNMDDLRVLGELGYITYIKAKNKSQNAYHLVRITEKAQKLLDDISIPLISNGDLEMLDYLINMYSNHEDSERTIGNKKKIAKYISIMRNTLGLTLHQFYYLSEYFLSEYPYTKVLEYVFFNSNKNRYGKFEHNMEDSPLYQFYDTKKKDVEYYWSQKLK